MRLLREQAGLHRRELAAELDCSEGHLRNIETAGTGNADRHQFSAVLIHRWLRVVSRRLNRTVDLDEISDPTTEDAAA